MREAIAPLPREVTCTITWDQGKEMAQHVNFTIATDVPIYFCDPHSPCNEDRTRTRTDSCANKCVRAPTSRCTPRKTLNESNEASTNDRGEP